MPAVGSMDREIKKVKDKYLLISRILLQSNIMKSSTIQYSTFFRIDFDDINIRINNYDAYYERYGDINRDLFKEFNRSIEIAEERLHDFLSAGILNVRSFAEDIGEFDRYLEKELDSIRYNKNVVEAAKELVKIARELEYIDKKRK